MYSEIAALDKSESISLLRDKLEKLTRERVTLKLKCEFQECFSLLEQVNGQNGQEIEEFKVEFLAASERLNCLKKMHPETQIQGYTEEMLSMIGLHNVSFAKRCRDLINDTVNVECDSNVQILKRRLDTLDKLIMNSQSALDASVSVCEKVQKVLSPVLNFFDANPADIRGFTRSLLAISPKNMWTVDLVGQTFVNTFDVKLPGYVKGETLWTSSQVHELLANAGFDPTVVKGFSQRKILCHQCSLPAVHTHIPPVIIELPSVIPTPPPPPPVLVVKSTPSPPSPPSLPSLPSLPSGPVPPAPPSVPNVKIEPTLITREMFEQMVQSKPTVKMPSHHSQCKCHRRSRIGRSSRNVIRTCMQQ